MTATFRPSIPKGSQPLFALVLCGTFLEMGGELLMAQGETDRSANVVLIAGPITGHPKVEAHEYEKAVTLIKHCLETSPNAPSMNLSAHYGMA